MAFDSIPDGWAQLLVSWLDTTVSRRDAARGRFCVNPAPVAFGHGGPQPARRGVVFLLASGMLTGCGFALRQQAKLPFDSVYLSGFTPGSGMAGALQKQLLASGVILSKSAAQAQAVILCLADTQQRTVVAATSAGQVRELQLRNLLRFSVTTHSGKNLLAATEISLTRDLTYNERNALAKTQEEQVSTLAMQDDIAWQVLRRLEVLHREE
jgi:LPS-assembly lipoprotein